MARTESVSYAEDYSLAYGQFLEYIPDLIWPLSVITYGRMRHDPQLTGVLSGFMLPLRRASWAIDPAGASPAVTRRVADDLGLPVLGQDNPGAARQRGVRWADHVRLACLHLVFGHMPFELDGAIVDGKYRLTGLRERLPVTIGEIAVDTGTGELAFITQNPGNREKQPPIPADHLAWYVHDREGAAWQGRSILRAAYTPWLLKHEMWRVHATSIRRFGMGVPVMEAPPGATPAQVSQAQQLASSVRVNDRGGVGTPSGFKFHLQGLEGSVPDALGFIRYLDQQMSRMALEMILDAAETPHGSRALGREFVDVFMYALQAVADEMAATASTIATRLVDWNEGEDTPAPRVVVGDVGSEREVTAIALQQLLASGALSADPALEEYVRREWKLPDRTTPWAPPVDPSKSAPVNDPAQASARGRRSQRPAAATPTLRKGHLVGVFKDMFDRRQQLEDRHHAALAAAVRKVAALIDVPDLVARVTAGKVNAAANPSDPADVTIGASVASEALQGALDTNTGDYLKLVGADAIYEAAAEGQTAAASLIATAAGDDEFDWDIEFATMLDALRSGDALATAVDGWVASHLTATSNQVGNVLASLIADGATRADMEQAVADALDAPALADSVLDHAIATAMGIGSRDYYAEQGVASIDFITAGDAQVCQDCDDAQNNGPYRPDQCPIPPTHFSCRCCLAPSDESIRDLAMSGDLASVE